MGKCSNHRIEDGVYGILRYNHTKRGVDIDVTKILRETDLVIVQLKLLRFTVPHKKRKKEI